MGVSEAMATFVADKCKKGNCAGCKHQRCSHECHRGELEQTEEPTVLDGPYESPGTGVPMEAIEVPVGETAVLTAPRCQHVLQGGRQCALVEGHSDAHLDEDQADAMEPIEISGGGDSEEQPDADTAPAPSEASAGESPVNVVFDELPIDWIIPSPDNVRRDLGDLSGLVESIKANGVLEPVVVVPCDDHDHDDDDHRYHLVAGERRWTAAQEAGLREIPAMVRSTISDEVRVELMLVENLQRKDLDPLEEADGYHRLVDLGMSQHTIASRVGCSQAHVSKRISLLGLAPKVVAAIAGGKVTVSEALELGKLDDHKHQEAALKEAKKTDYGGHDLGVDWAVEQQQRKIKDAEKRAAIEAEALKKGWPIVEPSKRGNDKFRRLVKESWEAGLHVPAAAHRKEPCHALLIDDRYYDGPKKIEVCTAPGRHAAKGESDVKEPKPEKRSINEHEQRQREEAKAKKAAGARRLEFLAERLTKKVARDKALEIVCEALVHRAEHEAKKQAVTMLGLDGDVREVIDRESSKGGDRLLHVAVAIALGTGDANARATWVGWDSASVQWLYRFLVDEGYELDEFETGQMRAKERLEEEAASNRLKLLARLEQTGLPLEVRQVVDHKIRDARPDELEAYLLERAEDAEITLTFWFQVCRVCGCTDENGCAEGCSWVEDDVCSAHAETPDSDGIADADKEPANA